MCGIAGLITQNPEARIGAMLKSIEHRGRDDEGVWTSPIFDGEGRQVCLGHRRLSIIDTSSAGHQPMLSQDGSLVVILNGEIYNYRELRDQLTSKGHTFRTQTDTEVLLAAWAEWGEACLPRLNGMFAFALWDARQGALFLVRDRVGIKPLYYAYQKPDTGVPRRAARLGWGGQGGPATHQALPHGRASHTLFWRLCFGRSGRTGFISALL
jgi:asparagine synthase (glutamine-hydrolysing)